MAEAQKEILESIRDIIGGNKASDDDVLELTEVVESPKIKPVNLFEENLDEPNDVLGEIDALLAADNKPEAIQEFSQEISFEEPVASENAASNNNLGDTIMQSNETLISPESAINTTHALKTLLSAAENASRPKIESAPFRNGDTVEDLVMVMLKPILKEWLDANLPKLVQTIVEKEIKKLVPTA